MTRFQGMNTVAEAYTFAVSATFAPNRRNRKRFQGINKLLGNGRANTVQQIVHNIRLTRLRVE